MWVDSDGETIWSFIGLAQNAWCCHQCHVNTVSSRDFVNANRIAFLYYQVHCRYTFVPESIQIFQSLYGVTTGCFLPIGYSVGYCYHKFKLRYLKNYKLFWSRVKELFEPIQARRKRCGMAAVAAPKICRERQRENDEKEKNERERERGEGRERRKGKESERESKRACFVGVNTSFELLQNCKRHEKKRGGGENPGKRLGVKDVRRDRNGRRKYSNRRQIEMWE